jgi:isoleucyl-tRNA synthetase
MQNRAGDAPYPEVPSQPRYPALEEETIAYWRDDKTFQASVELHPADTEYVFYDGPPFANGLPHYGHLLTGVVKDTVPRYQTMRGHRVERRFGWDCHGLPAEMEAEKELGVHGRVDITEFGIGRFNERCRSIVQRTTDSWEWYVSRQGRWVDFANDYKTMDPWFMESVLWAFRQLYDKGLVYEGYRVLPYCWQCETPLSNSETRMDDSTRDRTDPAVTVLFDIDPLPPSGSGADGSGTERPVSPAGGPLRALVWTTTPWTLPSNLALAVGPQIEYSILEREGVRYLIGTSRLEEYESQLEGAEVVGTVLGSALAGRRYRPLFPFFVDVQGAFRVLAEDFVATDEGTGIVHMAPGFGEDDQRACEAAGIEVVVPVDEQGRFTAEVPPYAGMHVFDANAPITGDLAAQGALVVQQDYVHSYPHCWRSDTPLIYRAMTSWFVAVTKIKDRMVELNQQIRWVPEHVRDGSFGKWLEGARDWSISRNRFWGTPIPVWKSDDPTYPRVDVYGSLDELERDFGFRPSDLHRPGIDELTRPNPDDPTGRSTMRRIPDVLDCWFESGSMPFAQLHYPFENAERFEAHFPADFIVEYVNQTRGWFYTLHVLSTALFDRPPFRACIAHGILLGDDGRKLSKRLRNYPDPEEVFANQGADAMRWYFLSAPILRGLDTMVESKALGAPVRQVLNPIWNTWSFLSLYGRIDGMRGHFRTDQRGVLDRYALAKTRRLVEDVTAAMDDYDLAGATVAVTSYLDALTNWYVRRSRDRFWRSAGDGDDQAVADARQDKADAYDTLHTVLLTLCKVAAPLLPFLTEEVFRRLTGERSVHLCAWPDADSLPADPELVETMDLVREVCSEAHSIRKQTKLRARLPLPSLTVAAPNASRLADFRWLISDEVNVKSVNLTTDVSAIADTVLSIVPSVLGPRLGADTQRVIAASKRGEWSRLADGSVDAGGFPLQHGEYSLRLRPRDETVSRALPGDTGVVALDTQTSPELLAEGVARDVVRLVQQARKDAGFHVADRVRLELFLPADAAAAIIPWVGFIGEQTLAGGGLLTHSADPEAQRGAGAAGGAARYELPDGRSIGVSLSAAGGASTPAA